MRGFRCGWRLYGIRWLRTAEPRWQMMSAGGEIFCWRRIFFDCLDCEECGRRFGLGMRWRSGWIGLFYRRVRGPRWWRCMRGQAVGRRKGRVSGAGGRLRVIRLLDHLCELGDEGGEEVGELAFDTAAYLHDLFVIDGLVEDTGGHVGDDGEAEDLEAHVAGDDDLVDGGHADEVGAEGAEGSDLCGGLVAGAEDGEVDAFVEGPALSGGFGDGQLAQGGGVGGGHVEEALACRGEEAEAGLVGAEGGVGSGEVDVVGDGDDGSLAVAGVDASGGVGDDELADAEEAEDAGGEGDLRHGVALVGVDAALHDGYGDAGVGASYCPEDEFAGVADDGGLGEVRDFGVGDGGGVLHLRGEVAEAGAEDDAEGWLERGLAADDVGGGLGLRIKVGHL